MSIFSRNSTTIDELKYNFDVGARANRFDVHFLLPKVFGDQAEGKYMGIRVESCSLPGRVIETKDWSEYGAKRKMPTGEIDDGGTIDFTFICDQSFADRAVIEGWQQMIFATGEGTGSIEHPTLAWYDDYIGTVKIYQHRIDKRDSEDSKRNALEYTLKEAYPVSFEAQSLSMKSNEIMTFTCKIAYRNWESKYIDAPKRSALNKGRVILDALLGGSNLLSRFGKEGKARKILTNLDTRATQINNIFDGG